MDSNPSGDQHELTDLERRLSGWRPSHLDLDAEAMLFAAGLAAGRSQSRPTVARFLCGLLAILAVGLGLWGLRERSERLAVADELHQLLLANANALPKSEDVAHEEKDSSISDEYLTLRRQVERDPDRWLALVPPVNNPAPEPPAEEPAILRAGQRGGLFGP